MKLTQIHYFCKLAQLQHYTNTAKELYITQPTLSDAIAALEEELGVKLFKKNGRNVQLTKEGEIFYGYAVQALNELERGIAHLVKVKNSIHGTIEIGCIPTLVGDFLPNIIKKYTSEHQNVKLNMYSKHTMEIVDAISKGKYDIGFCSKVENQSDLVFLPVGFQEIVAVVNTNNELSSLKNISLKEISKYNLISYRNTIPIGQSIKKICDSNKIKVTYDYDDEISIGGTVAIDGKKIGIAANTPFFKQFTNLSYIRITEIPKDFRCVYLVYNKNNVVTAATESFVNYVALNEAKHSTENK